MKKWTWLKDKSWQVDLIAFKNGIPQLTCICPECKQQVPEVYFSWNVKDYYETKEACLLGRVKELKDELVRVDKELELEMNGGVQP